MADCKFPNCKRFAQPNGYCIGHANFSSGVSVKAKEVIPNESDGQKEIKKSLKAAYQGFITKHPKCQIKSPECTKRATVIHHKAGRGKDVVLDQSTWMASCEHCNGYVEEHDAWARANGFKVSRLAKPANETKA